MAEIPTKKWPTYLNEEYIKKALEKAWEDYITVEECEFKLISVTGENFCSDIYRVHVKFHSSKVNEDGQTGQVQERSFILKDMLPGDFGSNELVMYDKVLPVLENILAQGTGQQLKLKANCLMIDQADKELYVLEDLNALGYQTADRRLGLDAEHSMVLMKKIAQFHAASMVFIEKHPLETSTLDSPNYVRATPDPLADEFTLCNLEYVLNIVEKWVDFDEIAAKLRTNLSNFNERMQKIVDPKSSRVNVINHGDLWVNNFLYNYEDAKPKDVVFVDYQNSFVASPGIDLNFFLYTSVQLNVLKTKRYELLRHYYKALRETLILCSASHLVPTWQMIMEEVRNCELYGYYALTCEFPVFCMSKETSKGFTSAIYTQPEALLEKRQMMYGNVRVLETLRYALDHLNELGVFD